MFEQRGSLEELSYYFVPDCMSKSLQPAYRQEVLEQLKQLTALIPHEKYQSKAQGYLEIMASLARSKELRLAFPRPNKEDSAALAELINAYRVTRDRESFSSYLWNEFTGVQQTQGKIRAEAGTERALSSSGLSSGLRQISDLRMHRRGRMIANED